MARRRTISSGSSSLPLSASALDKYTLYERCVQDPERMAHFLYAVHGGEPRIMREDFCGSGGVCRAWASIAPPAGPRRAMRAIGVDMDLEPLSRLKGIKNIKAIRADVLDCDAPADIISATNFPIGYWHTRPDLLRYLKLSRKRLNDGGVFICDTYGGSTAYTRGKVHQNIRLDDLRIRYTWEQREANPITAMVADAIHFRATRSGKIIYEEQDAFIYQWRLWSIPELREAMLEAGFKTIDVYSDLSDAIDHTGRHYASPVLDPDELDETYIVCLAART